jgi:hypothetical protein
MRVTEQGAVSNAAEPGASDTLDTGNPKPTRPNAFGAKGLGYAARAVVQGRSDGSLFLECQPRSHLCEFPLKDRGVQE